MPKINRQIQRELKPAHCPPLYGLNVIYLIAGLSDKFNIDWRNVYRRIFGMKPLESVKEIQFLFGRLHLKHLIDLSKMRFYRNSATCSLCILWCCLLSTLRSAIVETFIPMVLLQDAVLVLIVFLLSLRNLSSKWYIYSILLVTLKSYWN